jgi:hypothetical protein
MTRNTKTIKDKDTHWDGSDTASQSTGLSKDINKTA